MTQQTKQFRPWLKGFLGGSVLIACGSLLMLHATRSPPISPAELLTSISFIGVGGLWFRSALRRWSGKHIEQRSINSLSLPDGWTVTANYAIKGAGDIDLLIESPSGDRFAVEIKALVDVIVKPGFLFLTPRSLRRADGKKLSSDPLDQTISNADRVDAIPMLWCPKARPHKPVRIRGAIVVLGGQRTLKKALGIRLGLF